MIASNKLRLITWLNDIGDNSTGYQYSYFTLSVVNVELVSYFNCTFVILWIVFWIYFLFV